MLFHAERQENFYHTALCRERLWAWKGFLPGVSCGEAHGPEGQDGRDADSDCLWWDTGEESGPSPAWEQGSASPSPSRNEVENGGPTKGLEEEGEAWKVPSGQCG